MRIDREIKMIDDWYKIDDCKIMDTILMMMIMMVWDNGREINDDDDGVRMWDNGR